MSVRSVGHTVAMREDWRPEWNLCRKLREKFVSCSWEHKTDKPQKSAPFMSLLPSSFLPLSLFSVHWAEGMVESLIPAAHGWDHDWCSAMKSGGWHCRIEAWVTNLLKGEKTFGRGNLLRMWERRTWKGSILFWSGGEKKEQITLGKNLTLKKEWMREKISKTGIKTSECKWRWNETSVGCGTKCILLARSSWIYYSPWDSKGVVSELVSVLSFQILLIWCQWWDYHALNMSYFTGMHSHTFKITRKRKITQTFKEEKNHNVSFNNNLSQLL